MEEDKLYAPINLPKEKYVLGIEGIRQKELGTICTSMLGTFIVAFIYYKSIDYIVIIVLAAIIAAFITFLFVVKSTETNQSPLDNMKKYFKFLISTKNYSFQFINPFKSGGNKNKKDKKKKYTHEKTDVADIRDSCIFTKSNYLIGMSRIMPISIKNMTSEDKAGKTNECSAIISSDKEPFGLYSIPRNVDMDVHLRYLVEVADFEENEIRREILNEMIAQASKMVIMGEVYEHQYYIKAWTPYNENVKNSEKILNDRIENYMTGINATGTTTERIDDNKLIKLCNLFANGDSTVGEDYTVEDLISIPFISKENEKHG